MSNGFSLGIASDGPGTKTPNKRTKRTCRECTCTACQREAAIERIIARHREIDAIYHDKQAGVVDLGAAAEADAADYAILSCLAAEAAVRLGAT